MSAKSIIAMEPPTIGIEALLRILNSPVEADALAQESPLSHEEMVPPVHDCTLESDSAKLLAELLVPAPSLPKPASPSRMFNSLVL